MSIRHMGVFVRNINLVESILLQLGFTKIYDEVENVMGAEANVRKYSNGKYILELIHDEKAHDCPFHIALDGKIPDFINKMKDKIIIKGTPHDKKYKVDFVLVGDSIYFEFVRQK